MVSHLSILDRSQPGGILIVDGSVCDVVGEEDVVLGKINLMIQLSIIELTLPIVVVVVVSTGAGFGP